MRRHENGTMGEFKRNDVVSRAQAGDRTAHAELARRFRSMVFAVAMNWLRNPHEAEEVVQQVFIDALLKIVQLRDPRCVGGWLRQIAVRRALNRLSSRTLLVEEGPEALNELASREESPPDLLIRRERIRHVHQALDQLRSLDREVLEGFYLRGEPLKRLAAELQVPLGTVKRRLHVARSRLRELLEAPLLPADDGFTPLRNTRNRLVSILV